MSANRVVVHKRNPNPAHIDQLGTTIPMAELFATVPPSPPPPPKHLFEPPRRLVPVPLETAATAGDLPQASVASRSIQAIVFDLDTLFADASSWHLDSLNQALKAFGIQVPVDRAVSCQAALESLSREHRLPTYLHGLARQIEKVHAVEQIQRRCAPRQETELLLTRFRRQGYRLAIRSGASRNRTTAMLERAKWSGHFETILVPEDVGQRPPDSETYNTMCNRMELRPDQVVVVESSPKGQEAARNLGLNVCTLRRGELADWSGVHRAIERIESVREGAFPC
jgi:HAD superfamily hydrolase (TIGR01509 family)